MEANDRAPMTELTAEQRKRLSLQEAHDYLEAYYKKHATTIKDVIGSQWTQGMVSGRAEALKILKEAIDTASRIESKEAQ